MSETTDHPATGDTDTGGPNGESDAPGGADASGERVAKEKHGLALRWMHWVNFPVLMVMIWSGMRIYWADVRDPYALGVGGLQLLEFWPESVEGFFELDRRLAKGLAFHLVFGWLFVINGVLWTLSLAWRGGWRRIVPDRRSLADAGRSLAHDLHLRREAPVQGKYNPMQQLTYSAVWVISALLVASGFAIYKPVQLSFLVTVLGGYDTARFVHFSATILLLAFFFVHVLQVVRAGWGNFASMVTGYRLADRHDPEVAPPSAFGPSDPDADARDADARDADVLDADRRERDAADAPDRHLDAHDDREVTT
ncbi:cytochrome b/b6 domain-containing protein [Ilumatobacter sp.]|uniref:cytochrome b/b6 domain-containing protein n=1 Tax=Ilumatobacter sp. TaxID=1967498 RepID=UPI003B527343